MADQDARSDGKEESLASRDIRGKLDSEELEILRKLEVLDAIFAESRDQAEEFHARYIQPMLDAEVSLEETLELLVVGVLRPN